MFISMRKILDAWRFTNEVMTNMNLLLEATELASEFLEAENIHVANAQLMERAREWYDHTEITDPETLAAVVLYGDFEPGIRIDEIERLKEFYFPSEPFEVHIGEIEMALHDAEWR